MHSRNLSRPKYHRRRAARSVAGVLVIAGLTLAGYLSSAVYGSTSLSNRTLVRGASVDFLACTTANAWCAGFNTSLAGALERAGVKVTVYTSNFDPITQAQQAATAISQHPAVIMAHIVDAASSLPWLRRGKAAGIKMVALDTGVPKDQLSLVAANLLPDHCKLGRLAAINIQQGLRKEGVKSGKVIEITGTQSQTQVQSIMACFKQQLAKTPQYKIAAIEDGNWDPVTSATEASQLYARFASEGGIQAAFGMADYQAAPMATAAIQAGLPVYPRDRHGMVLTGSNCSGVGVRAVENGTLYGDATQSPVVEGATFAPYIIKLLKGQKVGTVVATPENGFTRANVKTYAKVCTY